MTVSEVRVFFMYPGIFYFQNKALRKQ